MEKLVLKKRNWAIATDKEIKGLGYLRIVNINSILHTITLFGLIIAIDRPIKRGKKQSAKWFSANTVDLDGYKLRLEYYTDLNKLPHIYYRNGLGTFIKETRFSYTSHDIYVIYDEQKGRWVCYDPIDVYIFSPNSHVEGYVNKGVFYATNKLSIG